SLKVRPPHKATIQTTSFVSREGAVQRRAAPLCLFRDAREQGVGDLQWLGDAAISQDDGAEGAVAAAQNRGAKANAIAGVVDKGLATPQIPAQAIIDARLVGVRMGRKDLLHQLGGQQEA